MMTDIEARQHINDTYLETCVTVDDTVIQEEFMRLPSDYFYWAQQYTNARKDHRLAKLSCDETRARLGIELRLQIENERGKATESMVSAAIDSSAEWVSARTVEIEAESEMVRTQGILEAIRTKREMLISLGAHARAEMKTI